MKINECKYTTLLKKCSFQKVELGYFNFEEKQFILRIIQTYNTHRSKQYGSIWDVHVDNDVGPGFGLGLFQNLPDVGAIALTDEYLSRHILCYFMQYILHF